MRGGGPGSCSLVRPSREALVVGSQVPRVRRTAGTLGIVRRLAVALGAALLAVSLPLVPAGAEPAWTVSWAVAMAGSLGQYVHDATVRQVAPLSVGGTEVRVQVSNEYGDVPLVVTAATVAVAGTGSAVVAGTLRPVLFGGATSVSIPVGASVYSSPVAMVVHAGERLAVSLYVPGSDQVSVHYDAGDGMSYSSAEGGGDLVDDPSGAGLSFPETWDRFVDALDVSGGATPARATVVLGDSISDGYNFRCPGYQDDCTLTTAWPTILAHRLGELPADERVGVANEAITANTVLPLADDDSRTGGGEAGVTRFRADVLDQPGVDRVLLLLGTNDLWFGASAAELIAGYRSILAQARAAGVPVIASTLLPRSSGGDEVWTPEMEANRQEVNNWILHSGAFAAVLDLAEVVGDVYNGACQPDVMFPAYDSGDNLHPNTAGQTAMADAIPTSLLGAGAAPPAPEQVVAVPTPGCRRDPLVTIDDPSLLASSPTTPTTTPTTTTPTTTTPTTTTPTTTTPTTTTTTTPTTTTTVGTSAPVTSPTRPGRGKGSPSAAGPIGSPRGLPGGLPVALGAVGLLALSVGFRARSRRRRGG